MDNMSLFSILTVSVPEFILDIMLGLVIIGEKKRVIPGKSNMIRMLIAVALMSIVSFLVRANIPVGVQTLLIQIVFYVFILKCSYNISIKQSISATTFFIGVILVINIVYLPPLFGIIQKTLDEVFQDDFLRFLCSLPERIFQVFVLVSIWQLKEVLLDIKKYNPMMKLSTAIFTLLFIIEYTFYFVYCKMFAGMPVYMRILFFIICVSMVLLNLLLFKFIIKYTRTVIQDEQETVRKKISEVNKMIRTIKNAGSEKDEN